MSEFETLSTTFESFMRRSETSYESFLISPEAVLEAEFLKSKQGIHWMPERIFISCSLKGIDGKTNYGSYKYITRQDLKDREYELQFWDGKISIFWTDVVHDPRGSKTIWKKDIK